jgi:hypothetical protein
MLGMNIWMFSTVGSGEASIFDGFLSTLTLFFTNGKFLGLLTATVP